MKYMATIYREAGNIDEKGIDMMFEGDDLTKVLTAVEVILAHSDTETSAYIRRCKNG